MRKEIALIGEKLVHTYPLIPRFNGCKLDKVNRFASGWVEKARLAEATEPIIESMRVTRMWSPDGEEMQRLADALNIENICGSAEEAIADADGVLVMDEVIESRTTLVEQSLNAGRPVFADKVLSIEPSRTAGLIDLARAGNIPVRSWSQLYFHPGLRRVRTARPGGVAFLNFCMSTKILAMYGIHIVSMLQGAFDGRVETYRPLSDGANLSALIELTDRTRVFLYVGEDIPFRGRLYYCNPDSDVIVNDNDDSACFISSARAIEALMFGLDVPDPGPERMLEAARLIDVMVKGGTDGPPVSFADETRFPGQA